MLISSQLWYEIQCPKVCIAEEVCFYWLTDERFLGYCILKYWTFTCILLYSFLIIENLSMQGILTAWDFEPLEYKLSYCSVFWLRTKGLFIHPVRYCSEILWINKFNIFDNYLWTNLGFVIEVWSTCDFGAWLIGVVASIKCWIIFKTTKQCVSNSWLFSANSLYSASSLLLVLAFWIK